MGFLLKIDKRIFVKIARLDSSYMQLVFCGLILARFEFRTVIFADANLFSEVLNPCIGSGEES
jgi:hypothetical protein